MDLKVKQLNSANASAIAHISSEEIKNSQENIAKQYSKKAKLPGFRAGKVPVNVVKNRYKQEIEKDAEQEELRKLFAETLKELDKTDKDLIGEPVFKKFDKNDKGIDAELLICFRPKIDTAGYEECVPTYATPKVGKKEIEDEKTKILSMVSPLKKISEKRGLQKGDFALFDFEGFVDDKAFDGGKAENYTLEIGSGQFIPGFEDGMIGLKVGEEKDINVTFPEAYGSKELAGKDAVFKVKVHEIQAREMLEKLDEETLKQLLPGEEKPSEAKFEERLKEQIKTEKLNKLYEEKLKTQFIDALVEKIQLDLPENIVEQELDMQMRQNWHEFSEEEIKGFQEDPKKVEEKRQSFKDIAQKSVKLTLLVDELARQLKINVNDQEVMQAIYFEALQSGRNPQEYIKTYQERGLLPAIKMAMIEDKLFKNLIFKDEKEDKKEENK